MVQLDAFNATMEIGTTSGAAIALHTSQPSISRAIRQLEEITGLILFERIEGRLRPTHEAYALLEVVKQSYIGMSHILRAAEELRNTANKSLSVACLPAFHHGFLANVVRRFRRDFKEVRLNLKPMLSKDILSAVLTRDIDIGIAAYTIADDRAKCEALEPINEVIVMHPSCPLAQRSKINSSDLAHHDLIMLDVDDPYRQRIESYLGKKAIDYSIGLEVPTSAAACQLVRQRLGIAILNPFTALDHAGPELVMRRFEKDFAFHTTLITPEKLDGSPIIGAFSASIHAEFDERIERTKVCLQA